MMNARLSSTVVSLPALEFVTQVCRDSWAAIVQVGSLTHVAGKVEQPIFVGWCAEELPITPSYRCAPVRLPEQHLVRSSRLRSDQIREDVHAVDVVRYLPTGGMDDRREDIEGTDGIPVGTAGKTSRPVYHERHADPPLEKSSFGPTQGIVE
jgi:hypothetical protein